MRKYIEEEFVNIDTHFLCESIDMTRYCIKVLKCKHNFFKFTLEIHSYLIYID